MRSHRRGRTAAASALALLLGAAATAQEWRRHVEALGDPAAGEAAALALLALGAGALPVLEEALEAADAKDLERAARDQRPAVAEAARAAIAWRADR